ncbi:hypothetical protein RUND412_002254 [Rhizina undulata]
MPKSVIRASIQAGICSFLCNAFAQWITAKKNKQHFAFDFFRAYHFLLYALLSTPPNFYWGIFLEEFFPAYVARHYLIRGPEKDGIYISEKYEGFSDESRVDFTAAGKLEFSWRNTLYKVALDQLVAGPLNALFYLCIMGSLNGLESSGLYSLIEEELVNMCFKAWKVWPAVALFMFVVVPVERRRLFSTCVGFGWNIFLSLMQ